MGKVIKRRKITNIVISPLKNVTAEEILDYDPVVEVVLEETPKAIEHALNTKKDTATLIEINNSGNYIEIGDKWWSNALNTILHVYEDKQDYEKCREISSLIKRVSDNKIPTTEKLKLKKKKNDK
jgi:hypothetical protein